MSKQTILLKLARLTVLRCDRLLPIDANGWRDLAGRESWRTMRCE